MSIEHRNIVAYGGFKKSISGYTRNRMQNPTINHEDMSECRGIAPPLLTLTLDGSEWSVSRSGRSTFAEVVLAIR
jgi:hypothetical protein